MRFRAVLWGVVLDVWAQFGHSFSGPDLAIFTESQGRLKATLSS
jgi:hypothetical protein